MKKKLLITGFEPFGEHKENPSALFLDWIRAQPFSSAVEIHTLLLPVSFHSSYPGLKTEIARLQPTEVVMIGLAANRQEITQERIGINWVDARVADNNGLQPIKQKILDVAEDGLFSTLLFKKLKISTSAGEYVCNYLMFLFLFYHRDIPGAFIHLPNALDYSVVFEELHSVLNDFYHEALNLSQ